MAKLLNRLRTKISETSRTYFSDVSRIERGIWPRLPEVIETAWGKMNADQMLVGCLNERRRISPEETGTATEPSIRAVDSGLLLLHVMESCGEHVV